MKLLATTLLCIVWATVFSQRSNTSLINSKAIDSDRYEQIKGSPYLYKDWQPCIIYGTNGMEYNDLLINYNGFEKELEARKNDQFITLKESDIERIELLNPHDLNLDTENFQRIAHPSFKNHLVNIWYDGEALKLIRDFKVNITEQKSETPGKTIVFKRFARKEYFFLIKDQERISVKLKKSAITEILGHKKEVEGYIKRNKLDLSKQPDVANLLSYFEKEYPISQ